MLSSYTIYDVQEHCTGKVIKPGGQGVFTPFDEEPRSSAIVSTGELLELSQYLYL